MNKTTTYLVEILEIIDREKITKRQYRAQRNGVACGPQRATLAEALADLSHDAQCAGLT
jgi:hypothetical protein